MPNGRVRRYDEAVDAEMALEAYNRFLGGCGGGFRKSVHQSLEESGEITQSLFEIGVRVWEEPPSEDA